MNSEDRRKARRERREQKRKEARREIIESIGSAEDVFCYHDMFRYGKECCKGVRWKQSIQNFERHLFSRTAVNVRRALTDYKPKKLAAFTINERGKTRNIEAPHVDDRQIQKALTKKALLPLYGSRMIYDNGASLRGKGLFFAQNQLDKAMRRHMKRYGVEGYIIIADFKGFFPNADREYVKARHKELSDERLVKMLDTITDCGKGKKGLPIGVETSQVEMISYPSALDNYMCCQMQLKGFGHYMDDYHIIIPPGRNPKEILSVFIEQAKRYGIVVSEAKTVIVPFGRAFKYCKAKRYVSGGKIVKRRTLDGVKRLRRKMKMFRKERIDLEDVYTAVNSTLSCYEKTKNHGTILKARRFFYSELGFPCEKIVTFRRVKSGVYLPYAV